MSFYRLYVYYLYPLGKLPPKIHYEERAKEYYREIDKFNKLANEMSLLCTYNLNSKDIDKISSKIQTCKRIIATDEKGEKKEFLIKNRVSKNQL